MRLTAATFIGIDLAWKSERNPTGAVVLRGDRSGARLKVVSPQLHSKTEVLEFVLAHATEETVLAIDAPLIILNRRGQRTCETEVSKRYGSREASCHTSNLALYPEASSVDLADALATHGYSHVDRLREERAGRILAEVYPHAAMVALFDLAKTIKYKKGPLRQRRAGLDSLRGYVGGLAVAEPPLLPTQSLRDFLGKDLEQLGGLKLKEYEDSLDALFCAYLGFYF
jgi:predicted RNase H-like nuclease